MCIRDRYEVRHPRAVERALAPNVETQEHAVLVQIDLRARAHAHAHAHAYACAHAHMQNSRAKQAKSAGSGRESTCERFELIECNDAYDGVAILLLGV
eukprot:173962-Pleurochrysis_carterae.AAC.1